MSTKLTKIYETFAAKCGRELAAAMANSFGATNGQVDDVPASRRDGLANALKKIMGGGQLSAAQSRVLVHGERAAASEPARARPEADEQEDAFAAIRHKAFRPVIVEDDEAPKPAAHLDPAAIYARWNASKRVETEG
jgi:hypothetical protein